MKTKTPKLTEATGRQLAVDLLREMAGYEIDDDDGPWPWSIQAMFRPEGESQDNVLLRYLDNIRQHGSREVLIGFCAVLTNHLGDCGPGGSTMREECYEKFTNRDITGKPGPWPRMEDDPRIAAS